MHLNRYIWQLMVVCAGFMCMATTCNEEIESYDMVVSNDSTQTIYVLDVTVSYLYVSDGVPSFNLNNLEAISSGESHVYKEKKSHVNYNDTPNEKVFLQIVVFNQDQINNYTAEELHENNIFEKQLIINYADLIKKDYKIYYPQDFK